MAEESPQTPPQSPVETGAEQTPAAATPPAQDKGAATDDDQVTLSKEDYKKLVSQRDRSNERARVTDNYVIEQMQKDDIKDFLGQEDMKKKYPDVVVEDLMVATSPDDFENIAKQTQARIDQSVQRKLGDIERAETPTLSPKERSEKLKQLKSNPGAGSLEQAIEYGLAG